MNEVQRFLIFAVVGISGVVVDLIIFWLLLKTVKEIKILEKNKIKSVTVFHAISFVISNINNYIWNVRFTFSDSNKENPSWVTYFGVSLFALAISSICIQYLAQDKFYTLYKKRVHIPITSKVVFLKRIKPTKSLWYIIIKGVAILVSMLFNYFGYKYLVF